MSQRVTELESKLEIAMVRDRFQLRKRIRSIRRKRRGGPFPDKEVQQLQTRLEKSCRLFRERAAGSPDLIYPEDLPISQHRQQLCDVIQANPVTIVCGETGSGKSTQLPKICLEIGRGIGGFIGHTQPRRLAARTIAARLANELHCAMGEHVGYKIRFSDVVSDRSYIKLMTDGMLLAETQSDRFLEQYDTILVDEAHERSLNIDFLLGYLKRVLSRRSDLRVIITSATLDAERFAAHFGSAGEPAPVVQIAGRAYPVETRYRPVPDEADFGGDAERVAIAAALDELMALGAGDVLTFLPTERDIRETAKHLRGWSQHRSERPVILPLYARLSQAEQNRVFQPSSKRKIVLATNVAESSLTVPGIRYVIDTGTARVSRYAPRVKVQRLPIEWIARASADQRQGRCGREGPGVCVRLYDEQLYESWDRFGTPEIRRTNLAAVILRMLSLGLGEPQDFSFLDPPRTDAVNDGYRTLFELEAVDEHRRLTPLGRRMSRLPVDPRIARIVLAGDELGCLPEVLILGAALEVQDPRLRPVQKEMLADEQHAVYQHPESDFFGLLRLWDAYHQLKTDHTRSQLSKQLARKFLSQSRLREWQEVHRQLRQMVQSAGLRIGPRKDDYEAVHRALTHGFLSHLALRRSRHEYEVVGGAISYLWPGSGVFAQKPQWVVAAEMVETNQRYLRCVARVEPEWIEAAGHHMVHRDYADPRWSKKQGTVTALEKVSLQGLVLCRRRYARFGKIDPGTARQLFIQHALVEGNVRGNFAFLHENRTLVETLVRIAAKSRDSGLLPSGAMQYSFYDERIPNNVFDVDTLRRWLRRAPQQESGSLLMRREDLLHADAGADNEQAFPSEVQMGGCRLRVEYCYDPNRDDDGLTLNLDRDTLSCLDPQQIEWLVPGLLQEKVVAMIRGLPKQVRRNLIPAPEVAARACQEMVFCEGPFLPTLAAVLSGLGQTTIAPSAFDLAKLPRHLRFFIRVLDEDRRVIECGRDVDQLRKNLKVQAQSQSDFGSDLGLQRDGLTDWDFETLPETVQIQTPGGSLDGYPALVDRGTDVSLRVLRNRAMANSSHRAGVRRLCVLADRETLRAQAAWLPDFDRWAEVFEHWMGHASFSDALRDRLADLAYLEGNTLPRDRDGYLQMLHAGRQQVTEAVQELAREVPEIMRQYVSVCEMLEALPERWHAARDDVGKHLDKLLLPGFLVEVPWEWLRQFSRYLKCTCVRLDRLRGGGGDRDREFCKQWWNWYDRFEQRAREHQQRGVHDEELQLYRWMLEEYRVSLFAQELGTYIKVSPQRLEKQWANVAF